MTTKIPEDKAGKLNGRRRALLDSNIWRYVIDNEAQGSLLRLARDGSYNVQIAPAVLYEALRLKDTAAPYVSCAPYDQLSFPPPYARSLFRKH